MNKGRKMLRRGLRASMTVEAAVVLPVVFFALAVCIRYTFLLHDRFLGNAVLNEVMEQYGHRTEEEAEPAAAYAEARLDHMLSRRRLDISVEGSGAGSEGSVSDGSMVIRMEDRGFAPEALMRRMTLCDGLTADRKSGPDTKEEETE